MASVQSLVDQGAAAVQAVAHERMTLKSQVRLRWVNKARPR
ncbi:hypothetical protein [Streptomyces sp. NPDC057545]